ncbi:MAG: sugar phosphate isomerase/epimerase [Anaerolineae bacterium]|nr:sugar phosphate isomerase/epimerase [Anaerolineae bacterium]MDW8071987.1 sugar phosphate isomerase/epimerase [Anaerolineae bacterium]
MLLAINGATTMKASLPQDIAAASSAGFKALEIWAAKLDTYLASPPNSVETLRALLDQAGVQPVSFNSIEFITFRPPNEYEQIQARCRQLCEIGQALNCRKIVVVPSPKPEGVGWEEIKRESVRVLRELAQLAASYEMQLAFEFLGFSWCSVRTLSECWEIVREVDRANVGLVLDTCHFYAGGSDLDSIATVDAAKIFIFHINDVEARPKETIEDAHRLLPGEGVIPLNEILTRLRHIHYDGLCSIELFRPEYWERDPAELAAAARTATLQVVGRFFQVV